MLIGVVSDTHGHVGQAQTAVRMLESLDVELVLHCGDIGSTEIVPLFAPWETHFVFGNVDHDEAALRKAIELSGGTCHGRFGSLVREGRRMAMLHGDDAARFRRETTSGQWDLVCYGHTHVAAMRYEGDTLVLNPGALYRARPHSLAVVELSRMKATVVEV